MKNNYLRTCFVVMSFFIVLATMAQKNEIIQKQVQDRNGHPTFVKFDTKAKTVSNTDPKAVLSSLFNLTTNDAFKSLRSENDKIGFTHERFQQYYKGIKVEKGVYIVHSRNNVIESLSGEFKLVNEINVTPALTKDIAINKAKAFVNAEEYMWEQDKTYEPTTELVVVAHDYGKHPKDMHEMVLAYKIDIYASKPLSRDYVYVNAQSGEIVHVNARIHRATATGSAATRYSGTKTITTDSYNGSYRLRDLTRGNGIITYDCNTSTNYTSAIDFTDSDNNWTAAEYNNSAKDNGALDAHWAGMMTYDYFKDVHGRSSFDGNGALMKTYVHFDSNYDNAYWNGSVFTFGDGSSFDILTSLDVFGHEFGHAVCSYTADLTYQNEEGALNEAFSDIWGCAIEYRYAPEKDNWLMGEDLGTALRSISDPKSKGLPDTYNGTNWAALASSPSQNNDYGGVHTNNGPFCYWFYLISDGGTGTNDNGDSYTVSGIGIDKAEQITFRIESQYMTSSSDYADARTYAIQAAQDLYGADSQEEISVTNAMYAIGVGSAYGPTIPEYCDSKGSDYSYEWMASVTVGSFTKTSAGNGYSDFTSSVIDLTPGQSYAVSLTPGFASSAYNEYWKIWIDYNGDLDFSDAGELVFDAGSLSNTTVTGSMNIASSASGQTRMRVSMKYNAAQTECETFSYGEVEDYTVNFVSGGDLTAPTAPTNLSASGVTQTTVDLSWTASTDIVGVTGYDVYQGTSVLGTVTGTSANITGLTANTSYAFSVKAKDAAGNVSNASNTVNVTTSADVDTEAPTAPTGLASASVTETSFTLSWTASTDNIAVTEYMVYQGGSLLATTSNTSYSVTGLNASTTYAYYITAKDAAGNVSTASSSLSVTTSDPITAEYCTSQGNNSSYEWISVVGIGTYTNSSSAAGYTDFTSENITLEAGAAVNVSLTPGFASSSYNEYWKIWIDYNNDAVFADDELAFDAGALSKIAVTGTMNILASANGTTRMRVSMKYNAAQTACESFSYGEVEDYTVTFGEAIPDTEAPTTPSNLASSDITETSCTLSWVASSDDVAVTNYRVFQDGSLVGTTASTSYSVSNLTESTTYTYYVKAIDAAGNLSGASSSLNVTTLTPSTSTNNLTLTITFDNYPEETSWTLKNSAGSTVASGGTYASQADGSTLVISIDDLANGCYDFTILDAYGDGMCCSYGNGSYSLADASGTVLVSGASFTSSLTSNFCVGTQGFANVTSTKNTVDVSLSTHVIYPNPTNSILNIGIGSSQIKSVKIYNLHGASVNVEMENSQVNVSELKAGMYFISIETEKEKIIERFVKE